MTGDTGDPTPEHVADSLSLGCFEFERGGSVPELEVAYETYGSYDPVGGPRGEGNAILVCHALTGSQHVATRPETTDTAEKERKQVTDGENPSQARAWWDDIVGPGKAIDTGAYFVVCVNVPGSCYGSSGPGTPHPDGGVWGSSFPAVTVADWTRAQRCLLNELGITNLHAVVGGSVGGMNVLDWVRQFPEAVDRAIPVATSPRLDAQLLAINAVARRAIRSDPDWHEGEYVAAGTHPDQGLAMARQLGHVTYLSKTSMDRKFGREPTEHDIESPFPVDSASEAFPDRSVESYLDYQGDQFVDRFDANSYLYLTRAMDDFDLAAGYRCDADAVSEFSGEALVLSFTGDWHFTVGDAATLASVFKQTGTPVAHHVIDSDHGHDAFLVEPEKVGPPIRDFLSQGVDGDAVEHTDRPERYESPKPRQSPLGATSSGFTD